MNIVQRGAEELRSSSPESSEHKNLTAKNLSRETSQAPPAITVTSLFTVEKNPIVPYEQTQRTTVVPWMFGALGRS